LVKGARWLVAIGFLLAPSTSTHAQQHPPLAWASVGTEKMPFCLLLNDDGSGIFDGGFTNLNPVHWAYSRDAATISLRLSRLQRSDADRITREYVRENGFLKFDAATKTVTSKVVVTPNRFFFMGYFLFDAASLDANEYALARKACKHLSAR